MLKNDINVDIKIYKTKHPESNLTKLTNRLDIKKRNLYRKNTTSTKIQMYAYNEEIGDSIKKIDNKIA